MLITISTFIIINTSITINNTINIIVNIDNIVTFIMIYRYEKGKDDEGGKTRRRRRGRCRRIIIRTCKYILIYKFKYFSIYAKLKLKLTKILTILCLITPSLIWTIITQIYLTNTNSVHYLNFRGGLIFFTRLVWLDSFK